MTARQIIVVDVETSGLDPQRHQAIEIAWWNLSTDERGRFIPRHTPSLVLGAAEIPALKVNRYIDRIADAPQGTVEDVIELYEQFLDYDEDDVDEEGAVQIRHTLAGSNPAFDAAFLANLFLPLEFTEYTAPWHHRLWDLSAYAAGVLGLPELPSLARVCELLDVQAPDHTAEGDVTATGWCFRNLQAIAAARAAT